MIVQKKQKLKIKESIFSQVVPDEMLEKLRDFVQVQQLYNAAIREVSTKLEILDDEFHVRFDHNPIHHMESRLKSPQSIVQKLLKKELPISTQFARESIYDIAGIRVICNYIDDIYKIADLLVKQDDITLVRTTDYIKHPKENGYRSLHLVIKVPVFLSDGREDVPVEIQIRTIAMDFWASLEHQLRYKSQCNIPEALSGQLKACAEESAALDRKMQSIYERIATFREAEGL